MAVPLDKNGDSQVLGKKAEVSPLEAELQQNDKSPGRGFKSRFRQCTKLLFGRSIGQAPSKESDLWLKRTAAEALCGTLSNMILFKQLREH